MEDKILTKKPLSKTELIGNIANESGLLRDQVEAVLNGLVNQIKKSMEKDGPETFTFFGLFKIYKFKKSATPPKEIPDLTDPGKLCKLPAQPPKTVVKLRALSGLKEIA